MKIIETRTKEYITPIKVIKTEGLIENADILIKDFEKQNFFRAKCLCTVKGKGYIILDFGREIFGTLRIQTNRYQNEIKGDNFRIRFGESLTETCSEINEKGATNDHSTRDMRIYMSSNSDMEWGSTGFRFVRIDFLVDQVYTINGIAAGFIHCGYEKKGSFIGYGRMKDIYDTAAYTLMLNMQNTVWDGIKRDQHTWVGDLYPEMLGILLTYGNVPVLEETLLNIASHYEMPVWYNDIPTYNIWFMLCVNDFVKYSGKRDEALISALKENLRLFEECVSENGEINFKTPGLYFWVDDFFEWPCFGTEDSKTGIFYLLKYTLKKIIEEKFFDESIISGAKRIYEKIKNRKLPLTKVKSVESLRVLCGEDVDEGLRVIENGGANGCSVFFMYFILKALAENGKCAFALKIADEYYGAMLDKGATTFWENFDMEWTKNSCRVDRFPNENEKDIHGDFGANCYAGFRHSLCHGWSCGVIAFLAENVLGIKIKKAGFVAISVNPFQDNEYSKGAIPTPFGEIIIEKGGKEKPLELTTPKEINIIS